MMEGIKEESVGYLFNLQVEIQENPIVEEAAGPAGVAAPSRPAAGGAPPAPPANGTGSQKSQPQRNRAGGQSRTQGRGRAGSGQPDGAHAAPSGAHAAPSGAHAAPAPGETPAVTAPGLQRPKRPSRLQYSAPSADEPGHVEQHATASSAADQFSRVGRNDLCPCGSGRKYKRCHGDPRNRAEG
jgi:preprotein translocase subunit SecA